MKCSAMPHEEARQLVASLAFVLFIGVLLLDSIPLWTHPPLETGGRTTWLNSRSYSTRTWKSDDNVSIICANGVIRKTHWVRLQHGAEEYKLCAGCQKTVSQGRNRLTA